MCGGLSKLDRPYSVIDASFDELACFSLRQKQKPEPPELCQNNKVCSNFSKIAILTQRVTFDKLGHTLFWHYSGGSGTCFPAALALQARQEDLQLPNKVGLTWKVPHTSPPPSARFVAHPPSQATAGGPG